MFCIRLFASSSSHTQWNESGQSYTANENSNLQKENDLTSTWFQHATFWSAVTRAAIAPRSHWLAPSHVLSHFSSHCLRAIELLKFRKHRSSQSWPRFTFRKSFSIFCCRLFGSLPVTQPVESTGQSYTANEILNLQKKRFDLDVIRTRNHLIWSQTRYHCATKSLIRITSHVLSHFSNHCLRAIE